MNIMVSLTTTKFTLDTTNPNPELFRKIGMPMCCAQMGLVMSGISEQQEAVIADACKAMARMVVVDSAERTLFIGEDPQDETTGVVVYKEEGNSEMARHFFQQWDALKSMIFELQVIGAKDDIFVLNGFWENGHWKALDIVPSRKTHIVIPSKEQ